MYGLFTPIAALIAKRDAFLTQHSLRFDDTNDYLSLSVPDGDRTKWTWSAWVKIADSSTRTWLFSGGPAGDLNNLFYTMVESSANGNGFKVAWRDGSQTTRTLETNASYDQTDKWYHFVLVVDTAQSSVTDKMKLYVDGVEINTWTTDNRANLPASPTVNQAGVIVLGTYAYDVSSTSARLNGQLAEVHFIDGTALDQTYFGETRGGVWLPKQVTGVTYGNNGFYLDFSQPSSTTNAFNAVTYTGSASDQDVTVGFQPDFAWIKCRNETISHSVWDSVRGADKLLASDTTAAETTLADTVVTDADGMTLYGGYSRINSSTNSRTYVAWCWKAGGSSNTYNIDDVGYSTASAAGLDAGSITPTGASVNTAAGFSIIKYTGNGSTASVSHGLNETPECIIVKNLNTSATSWSVWHDGYGDNNYQTLYLDGTGNLSSLNRTRISGVSNQTFSLANHVEVTGNTDGHIAYCWHSVEGYSKCGSYVGNGSSNGPIINTGFRPAFIMIKNTTASTTDDWHIIDNARDFANPITYRLKANLADTESSTDTAVDFLADGFQLINTSGARNASGHTYIYMAFADTSPNLGVDTTTDGTGVTLLLDGTSVTDASGAGNDFTNSGATLNATPSPDHPYAVEPVAFDFPTGLGTATTQEYLYSSAGAFNGMDNGDPFTIELWAKADALGSATTYRGLFGIGGYNTSTGLTIRTAGTTLAWWVGGANYTVNHQVALNTTDWFHIALVYDGSVSTLFINGVPSSSTSSRAPNFGTNAVAVIGRNYGGSVGYHWNGQITDVRITRGVARYSGSFTPPTSALSADVSGITGSDDVVLLLDGTSVNDGSTGGQNDATLYDNASANDTTVTDPYGGSTGSYVFDGSNDYGTVSNHSSLDLGTGDFTIEMWVYLNTTSGNQYFFDLGENELAFIYDGGFRVWTGFTPSGDGADNTYNTTTTFSANQWYHVALTRSGNNKYVFVNGEQVSTDNTVINVTGRDLTLGDNGNPASSSFLNGYLKDIRITKGAALYPFHPPISALTNDDTWDKPKNDFSVEGNITPDDQLLDTPNLRFATLDASNLSDANLTTQNLGTNTGVRANSHGQKSSGKWYWETSLVDTSPSGNHTGVWDISETMGANYVGQTSGSWGLYLGLGATLPRVRHNGTYTEPSGVTAFASGDIISIAIDLDSGKMWYAKNGVWFESGNPSAGTGDAYDVATNPSKALTGTLAPADIQRDTMTYNFGQDHTFAGKKSALVTPYSDAKGNGEFYYQPPSGFLALATAYK